ncbi:MAG: extracellular solute-binding protein [Intrasporangium sp.]|uniref:extracellular solute-binding protein n=1 Tax=Intrasporangium sp. TaxID=1925024 RepID=UPI002649C0FD|nr:extracellular solute-binding protein [Intrasporangium sp.]MDN5796509.1 extracellular solute-binding protein [Intrasporangium sp.]
MSRSGLRLRVTTAIAGAVALLTVTAGCSSSPSSEPGATGSDAATTLTVYTDQHAALVKGLTGAYTKQTGVTFDIQQDATVGQIQAEGDASPADLFLSEDPAPVAQLGKAGLLEPIEASTVAQVQPGLSSPQDLWVAYAARARVLYYNPELIDEADLPKTLLTITDPQYKGKFAYAPSGAFVATTQYLISTIGLDASTDFLKKVKANGVNEQKNGNVRDTVEAGKHAMGLSNHYYWWIKAAEVGGPEHMTSKIYHFPETDPGNLVLSSGAAILKNSTHKDAAAKFVQWLTSKDGGQQILSSGDIDTSGAQYPVALGTSSELVGALSDIASPTYDMSIYADQSQAQDLLKSLGITT